MHCFSFIFSILPAAVLAVLPSNVTYPRHVIHKESFAQPSFSVGNKSAVVHDLYPGVLTEYKAICTQPVVTVTTTVTSSTSCGKDQPSHTIFPLKDCRYDQPKLSTCAFFKTSSIPQHTGVPSTQHSKTTSVPTKSSRITSVPMKSSKSISTSAKSWKTTPVPTRISKTATITWVHPSTTITAGVPWPVVPTPTIKILTMTNGTSRFFTAQHTTTIVWAETYTASTVTAYLNTTSISGNFINPASLVHTVHADKTKTSTVVDFQTMTKVHAHTVVPVPFETADDFSDDDAYPSETRLPDHPMVPAPISLVHSSQTLHISSTTKKSTATHSVATAHPQDNKSNRHDAEGDEVDDKTYKTNSKDSSIYSNDDTEDEADGDQADFDEDVTDIEEETTSAKSHSTKATTVTTGSSTEPSKAHSTKTTDQGRHSSSQKSTSANKPQQTVSNTKAASQSTAKGYTITSTTTHAWVLRPTSSLRTKASSGTKSVGPSGRTTTSSAHSTSLAKHTSLQWQDLYMGVPVPSPPYNKTYIAQSLLSTVTTTFYYKPLHHGHLSTVSNSLTTKTEDRSESFGATATQQPVSASTANSARHLSGDQSKYVL